MKMKKLYIFLAVLATALSFTSCEDDKEPVFKAPTEFKLNTPALQNELLTLSPEGTFELTCSQPDYGYSAVTNYSAEVSLTEDFADYRTIRSAGTGTLARMTFKSEDLALALCDLHGYADKDAFIAANPGPEKVYLRAVASLAGVAESRIVSNTIYLSSVQSYYAVKEPGRIFVVGAFSNGVSWNVGATVQEYINASQVLDETGVETGIYTGVVNFPAGEVYFRFYTELGDWGSDGSLPSIGPNAVDGDNTEVTLSATAQTLTAVPGKGSWFTNSSFAGGPVTMMFDMNRMELTITAGDAPIQVASYVYMVGNQAGWAEPSAANQSVYDDWRLTESSTAGVYTATFTISTLPDGDGGALYCRFYKTLGGWGPAQWAATENNQSVALGTSYPTTDGEQCFMLPDALGKTITVTLDTNNNNVTFSAD